MDYEALTVQELREACQARGLGTARSRAELIQRLTDHDAKQQSAPTDDEHGTPGAAVQEAAPTAEPLPPAAPVRVFRKTFAAGLEGPDEETHLAYRQATIQAAAEAGLTPRGDARLAEFDSETWVYEVSVRWPS